MYFNSPTENEIAQMLLQIANHDQQQWGMRNDSLLIYIG